LEGYPAVSNSEEAASSQTQWVTPLKDCYIASLVDYFRDTHHGSGSKFSFEHLAYCGATLHRLLRYLVVYSIFVIKLR
jgi:hypothetical protein